MVPYHENSVTEARNRLGDRVFQTAFDHGRALTLDDAAARALREQPPGGSPKSAADEVLTPREQQVAELVAQGLTNRAIADKLVISQRTVDGHVDHILNKLGYGSRTRIAAWVLQRTNGLPQLLRPRDGRCLRSIAARRVTRPNPVARIRPSKVFLSLRDQRESSVPHRAVRVVDCEKRRECCDARR